MPFFNGMTGLYLSPIICKSLQAAAAHTLGGEVRAW
jgi:hypothetical protein